MFRLVLILNCVVLGVLSATYSVGPKCKLDRTCVIKHSAYVYKRLVEDEDNKLDPLYEEKIEEDFGTVKYTLTDFTTTGLKKCSIKDANMDLKNLMYEVDLYCPEFHVEGNYDIHGTLLDKPIEGNGKFTVDTIGPQCKPDRACVTKQTTYIYKSILEDDNNHLDPMYKELIEGDSGTIKYSLTDTTITGFRKCNVKNANLDFKTLVYEIELFCPGFHVEGKYDAHGFLLGNSAEGNGEFTIDTKAYDLKIRKEVSLRTKGDKYYLQFHKFNIDATPIDDLVYDFKNSFNGQKELADDFLKFVNEHSKAVAKELQGPLFIAALEEIDEVGNKFMEKLPLQNLFIF